MTTAARLYRLATGDKVGSLRLLLYPILGYGVSGTFTPALWLLNTAVILGGVLFASLLNDYHDAVLLGEDNAVAELLASGALSHRAVTVLTWGPWIASLACFFVLARCGVTVPALILLWVSFLLAAAYCAPPLRLKARRGWGLVAPPVGIFLLYLQGLVLTRLPDQRAWLISLMLLFYTWYLDFLHLSEDALYEHEVHRLPGPVALAAARWTAVAAAVVAALASWLEPLLLVAVAAWTLRALAVWRRDAAAVAAARKHLWSPVYRIEEFAVYVAVVAVGAWLG